MDPIHSLKTLATFDPKATVAVISPFITFALNRFLSPSVKLYHSVRHKFHFLLNIPINDENGNANNISQSVVVQYISIANSGRSSAKDVELVFNWRPNFINVWPIRVFREHDHPDGRYSIHLDSLAPKETFGLEMLCVNRETPNIINARSQDVESKIRTMIPQVQYPRWLSGIAFISMMMGFMVIVYGLLLALTFAID